MHLVWTENAISQLIELQRFIALDKPEAARKLTQRILTFVERLVQHPHLGRAGREPETRELIVPGTPYIIPYRIVRARLEILAVHHTARNRPDVVE
jgi:toxin ParE1/3/4